MDSLIAKEAAKARPLWIALAECIVALKPGRDVERMEMLTRIYSRMRISQQMLCRGEIARLRARGIAA